MSEPSGDEARGRGRMLAAAFLGWLCAGLQMGLGPLVSRPALRDLFFAGRPDLLPVEEAVVGRWFAWLLCAFLLGGAFGGLLFGWAGDRFGRVRALAASVACYALFTGLGWWAHSAEELLLLRFLTSLGIGGTWPNGVALVSEAWPSASRPVVAGVMGAAANVGILVMAVIGQRLGITADSWRWSMLVAATPLLLAMLTLAVVPESPRWLASRRVPRPVAPLRAVFRPPLLQRTLLGVVLGTIPLVGTWSSGKWMIPWAEREGGDPALTQAVWAAGAVLGSAVGGWLAERLGRRVCYFVVSLASLALNVSIYRLCTPGDPAFLPVVFLLGLVATVFFGWLPLYLPELFPTAVRATGTGVTFNFGRFASAGGVLAAGWLMTVFEGSYARVGQVSALVYGLGMVVILFAPDTRARPVESDP